MSKLAMPNRKYWLWVTKPEYYLEDDGTDREVLDPSHGIESDGWWTCHKTTQKGDLIFLWRTTPKKDIGYLMQAESNAYSISDQAYIQSWDYGCDYHSLYKFQNSVKIDDLHKNPIFENWGAYNGRFQRRVFEIPFEIWQKLNQIAISKNPEYKQVIEKIQKSKLDNFIILEEELEEKIFNNLQLLKKFGYDLELYNNSASGANGRQHVCIGNGGRIDLLCYDKTKKRYVVIELKNVTATHYTFGQISNYMGWVQSKISNGKPVEGLVISRGKDVRFESAAKTTKYVNQIDIEKLGFK